MKMLDLNAAKSGRLEINDVSYEPTRTPEKEASLPSLETSDVKAKESPSSSWGKVESGYPSESVLVFESNKPSYESPRIKGYVIKEVDKA